MRTAALLSAVLLLFACGCTKRNETEPLPAPTPEVIVETAAPVSTGAPRPEAEAAAAPAPAPESIAPETPAPTPAPPVHAGVYLFESGEYGTWRLNIKENGTFSLICGESIYNGEGWSDTGFGTVITGPTEAAGSTPFFDEFGSSEWRIEGESCSPVF